MIQWKALIRDVVIIFLLTAVGGFIVGITARGQDFPMGAIAISNLIFMILGFTISGCLTKVNRFRHLIQVALGVWLLSAFNMLFSMLSLIHWLSGIIAIGLTMLIGGGLSFLFVKSPKEESH